ncbi:MAG: hypothetical protein ABFD66_02385 [Smithella sp.]
MFCNRGILFTNKYLTRDLMTKEELLDIITKLLKTDVKLDFLMRLDMEELKVLIASIRERIG